MKLTAVLPVLAACLLPTLASAQTDLVNTGTPTGTTAPAILSTAQSVAAEFDIAAGQTVTSLSAYLTQGTAQPGDAFTFTIYSSLGRNLPPASFTVSEQWETNGWTTASNVDWTPATSGNYWLVLTSNSSGYQFDLPPLDSNTTGNPPGGLRVQGTRAPSRPRARRASACRSSPRRNPPRGCWRSSV